MTCVWSCSSYQRRRSDFLRTLLDWVSCSTRLSEFYFYFTVCLLSSSRYTLSSRDLEVERTDFDIRVTIIEGTGERSGTVGGTVRSDILVTVKINII